MPHTFLDMFPKSELAWGGASAWLAGLPAGWLLQGSVVLGAGAGLR